MITDHFEIDPDSIIKEDIDKDQFIVRDRIDEHKEISIDKLNEEKDIVQTGSLIPHMINRELPVIIKARQHSLKYAATKEQH